jgi:hypothetical protein
MIRTLLTELRRSPGAIAFPLLAAVEIAAVWQDNSFWIGDWRATSIHVQFGNILLCPFVATLAAWAAGRERRSGHGALAKTMPRAQIYPVAVQWFAVTFWGLLAYTVGFGFAVWRTAPVAAASAPWPSYLVLGAAVVCASSAVGYALGKLTPWRAIAPLAGVGIIAYFVILSIQNNWLGRIRLIYGDMLVPPQYQLRASVLGAELLWAVGLVVLGLTAASSRGISSRVRILALILASFPAAGAVTGAVLLGGSDYTQRQAPDHVVCEGYAPKVCVWPEHAKWVATAAEVAHRLNDALGELYRFPPIVYEEGLPEAPSRGGPVVRINRIPMTPAAFVTGLRLEVLPEMPPDCWREPRRLERFALISAWMSMRATGQSSGAIADGAKLSTLLSRSPSEQRAWVRENLPAATDCSAPVSPSSLEAS